MNRESLEDLGFIGFQPIKELRASLSAIQDAPGVYVVLRESDTPPVFLERSIAGHYRGKDPTVSIEDLEAEWISGTHVLYVGCSKNLRNRLRMLIDYGKGKPAPHTGGRRVWQLDNSSDHLICWRLSTDTDHRIDKNNLLDEFSTYFGRYPFANKKKVGSKAF
jgi:hypothetical protein